MDTLVSDDNWGAWHPRIFIVTTLITDILFGQFFIRTAVHWGEHGRQRTIMDTSFSDILEAYGI